MTNAIRVPVFRLAWVRQSIVALGMMHVGVAAFAAAAYGISLLGDAVSWMRFLAYALIAFDVVAVVAVYIVHRSVAKQHAERLGEGWVAAADNAAERDARRAKLAAHGLAAASMGAFDSQRTVPAFNIDGTPMVGGNVDAKGNMYGVTDDMFQHGGDWNNDTGNFVADTNAYVEPFGMNDGSRSM